MNDVARPYFLENEEWYYYDEDEEIFKLTDKAPQEAIDSYNEYYSEEETEELTDLEERLFEMFKIMKIDSYDIVPMMLELHHAGEEGQIELIKYLRDIDPNNYDKEVLLDKIDEIGRKYNKD